MAVKIVTDSTADLPADLINKLDITVVPLNVHFGEETFQDGVDLDPDQFFQRLASSPALPTTSQPSPGAFQDVYRRLTSQGHRVVSIHISERLSGTLNSAHQAKEQLGDVSVEILDSRQASVGLGLVVVAAAQAAQEGAAFKDVIEAGKGAVGQVQLFALLDTLEYLRKGGRIGKVRGFIGTLLKVRPIITVKEGIVESVISVRARAQGMQYMTTVAEERAPLLRAAVVHTTTPKEAQELAERLRPLVSGGEVVMARIGPVIGTYTGPGTIGIAIQSEKKGPAQ